MQPALAGLDVLGTACCSCLRAKHSSPSPSCASQASRSCASASLLQPSPRYTHLLTCCHPLHHIEYKTCMGNSTSSIQISSQAVTPSTRSTATHAHAAHHVPVLISCPSCASLASRSCASASLLQLSPRSPQYTHLLTDTHPLHHIEYKTCMGNSTSSTQISSQAVTPCIN